MSQIEFTTKYKNIFLELNKNNKILLNYLIQKHGVVLPVVCNAPVVIPISYVKNMLASLLTYFDIDPNMRKHSYFKDNIDIKHLAWILGELTELYRYLERNPDDPLMIIKRKPVSVKNIG